jgi:Domain of unknown function (DUF6438)
MACVQKLKKGKKIQFFRIFALEPYSLVQSISNVMKYLFLIFYSVSALFYACKGSKKSNSTVPTVPEAVSGQPLIALETHGCRGYCPTYKLTFLTDQTLQYEGIRSVEKMGASTTKITPAEYKTLEEAVKKVNLWQFPERFESTVADAPASTMTVYSKDKNHSVTGTIDRPKPIQDLELMMKNLAEAHGLRVKKGVDPNEIPADNKRELIVKLKENLNAGNWAAQFQEIKVRLVRRLGAENIWLVSFDGAQVSEKDMIEILKSTEGVIQVESNKKTDTRN